MYKIYIIIDRIRTICYLLYDVIYMYTVQWHYWMSYSWCDFSLTPVYVVWEDKYGGHPPELHHPGDVPALQWPGVHHHPLQDPREIWPLHLRFLRCGNDYQNYCHGTVWEIHLSRRFLEPIRLLYCDSRVSLSLAVCSVGFCYCF